MVLPLLQALNTRPATTFELLLPSISYRIFNLILQSSLVMDVILRTRVMYILAHDSTEVFVGQPPNFHRFVIQVISPNVNPVGLESVPIPTTHVVSTHCTNLDPKTRK